MVAPWMQLEVIRQQCFEVSDTSRRNIDVQSREVLEPLVDLLVRVENPGWAVEQGRHDQQRVAALHPAFERRGLRSTSRHALRHGEEQYVTRCLRQQRREAIVTILQTRSWNA